MPELNSAEPTERARRAQPSVAPASEETTAPDQSAKRFGRGQLMVGLSLALVAFLIITQAGFNQTQNRYAAMRQDDLIQVLDGLQAESALLQAQINELQQTRDALQSGADAAEVAAREAAKQITTLSLLSGTSPAQGPGIRITISAPQGAFKAALLLNAVQELKDAGAEVIEINDQVRLGLNSWFADRDGQLIVDGQAIELPITLDVIGEPQALSEGARFRGGLVSQIESSRVGGTVQIDSLAVVKIDSVRTLMQPRYSRPA